MPATATRPSAPIVAILSGIAAAAILLPSLAVRFAPAVIARPKIVAPPRRVVPPAEIPAVEIVKLQDIAPEDARAINAEVPFSTDPIPPARAYRMLGGPDDIARATDCLAAAVYYEAGDDAEGERAVAQVVLNRLRHPAFPKSVCGVVFQGSERTTGCQFTFSCDGALNRTPSDSAWRRAREIAGAALGGAVYKPVGYATHYHTDWVVPYWSASLDKIAELHTHLFFRWTGWWGTPRAFARTPSPIEAPVAALARLSDAHRMGGALAEADGAVIAATPFFGRTPMALPSDQNSFITSLNPAQAASFAALALQACGERTRCKFMGWTDVSAMPFTTTMTPQQMAAMSFSYLRDRASGLERTLWNCGEFKRSEARQCMKRQALRIEAPAAGAIGAPPAIVPRGPEELSGVRRKTAGPEKAGPEPSAEPSPAPVP